MHYGMHGESQACVNTAALLLPLLPPRPQLLLLECEYIETKKKLQKKLEKKKTRPLTAVPAYPVAKNGRY